MLTVIPRVSIVSSQMHTPVWEDLIQLTWYQAQKYLGVFHRLRIPIFARDPDLHQVPEEALIHTLIEVALDRGHPAELIPTNQAMIKQVVVNQDHHQGMVTMPMNSIWQYLKPQVPAATGQGPQTAKIMETVLNAIQDPWLATLISTVIHRS